MALTEKQTENVHVWENNLIIRKDKVEGNGGEKDRESDRRTALTEMWTVCGWWRTTANDSRIWRLVTEIESSERTERKE